MSSAQNELDKPQKLKQKRSASVYLQNQFGNQATMFAPSCLTALTGFVRSFRIDCLKSAIIDFITKAPICIHSLNTSKIVCAAKSSILNVLESIFVICFIFVTLVCIEIGRKLERSLWILQPLTLPSHMLTPSKSQRL